MVQKLTRYGLLCLMLLTTSVVQAQYFGRNKPAYKKFDFKVMESPNFKLYHYFQNKEDALKIVQDSERWYKLHQEVLQDTIADPNPLIIYKNHADFQQTTAISGSIGVGTGGVTEGLKNRVVMPITLSNKQTDHVLGHELVHAFQYNMMRTGDSLSLNNMRNLPLWMVEGLAEYMSIGNQDPNTAMWMRDAILQKDIPTLKDLTRKQKYFPYRWGQAFWSFVAGTWGDEVIEPLFRSTAKYGYEDAIKGVLKVDAVTLGNMWKTSLENYYKPYIAGSDTTITAGRKLLDKTNAGRMNISPVLSPNGKFIAYMSDQDVLGLDLFLADAQTGKITKRLASLATNPHLDNFNFMESAGTFSPYGERFAFVVFEQGVNKLAIVDVARGKIIDNLTIPGVDAFAYPSWSPDGQSIVVSGLVEAQSDLYLYNLRSKKVKQLTKDAYSDLMPSWSADGSKLVFSTDRPVDGKSGKSSYNLAEIDIISGKVKVAEVFTGADNLNASYEPNSNNILFLSDRDGYRNMYRYSPEQQRVERLTNYVTGISGITSMSPAMSVAREEGKVAYSYYRNNAYTIYTAPLAAFERTAVDAQAVDMKAGILPPLERKKPIVTTKLAEPIATSVVAEDSISVKPYRPEFKLDYISNTAGVGISNGPYGTGMNGGVNMIFSDILGNNQLFAAASLNGEIYDFGGQFAYLRQKGRFQWGAQVSHIPFLRGQVGYTQDSLQIGDSKQLVDNMILQKIRMFQQQANLIGNYVFSTTRRLEFGAGISRYSYRIDQFNHYYKDGFFIKMEDEKLEAPDPFHFQQVYAAYVGDNSYFGLTSPLAGHRYRLHAERYFGEFNVWTGLADYRKYFFLKPFSVAFRVMHQARYGEDSQNGKLAPLSLALPGYMRGFGNDYFQKSQEAGINNANWNDLYGSRIAVANAELRLPFTGPEQLALIKSGMFLSDFNLFVDAGMAWSPKGSTTSEYWGFTSGSSSYKPLISAGASLRVNLFGYMIVEPFYAIPLQKNGTKLANFGVNFTPGW
ncbi:tolB protein precursor [Pontibacter locisalis]|uniref:TolB protein n=1 Tax=Pontibacter locisalis TaxID=1719035 RepID=A0ABW5IJA7_9BACT